MLDIGFSELLLIAVVALVVVGPKDIPVVMKHVFAFLRELRGIYSGIKTQMVQVMDEAGVNDLKREMTTIIDLEGKPQQAYDVSELKNMSASIASGMPLPLRERIGEGASKEAEHSSRPLTQPSPARGEGFQALPEAKQFHSVGPESEHSPSDHGKFNSDD